jgi:aspartate ammonia-lyase
MRIEEDFLGKIEVPDEAYYGSFTTRASKVFRLSGMQVDPELIWSVALIKRCAAVVNKKLGKLDAVTADAIVKAVDAVLAGALFRDFLVDAFQAGAGTPLHMNVNEVIANRAEELLGGKKGQYRMVHPNNHVNMSQSSNDVVPTAIRIASIRSSVALIAEARALQKALEKKAKEKDNVETLKIGRTHLQDAVPMTYGQTFSAWARAIEKDIVEMEKSLDCVREIGIGGTATGSGITAHPKFREMIVEELNKGTEPSLGLRMAKDPIEMAQDMNDFTTLSAALRRYAITLNRIANDLRLLVSGPKGGIAELIIPEVEPGSSIMPGKINPSVPEAVNMVCWQVMGNDQAVTLAAQSGQLELNFGTPLIAHNILQSERLLTNCSKMFREHCIEGMKIDKARVSENFERSFGYATALNPYLGYKEVSLLVREALAKKTTLKQLIVQKKIMSESDLEKIISKATGPCEVDKEILKKVRKG